MVKVMNSKVVSVKSYDSKNSKITDSKGDINDKSFMKYVNLQYDKCKDSMAKTVSNNAVNSNYSVNEDYTDLFKELNDDINTLKNDYKNSSKATSISDKAEMNNKVNNDIKKLSNALHKVEDIIKKGNVISKNDLNKLKSLIKDIPNVALKSNSINDMKNDISSYIESVFSDSVNDNIAAENIQVDKAVDDSEDNNKKDSTITNEQALQMLQNIIDILHNSENTDTQNINYINEQLNQLSNILQDSNLNTEDLQKISSDLDEILQMLEPVQNTEEVSKLTNELQELKNDVDKKIENSFTAKSEVISELKNTLATNKVDSHKYNQSSSEEVQNDNSSSTNSDSSGNTDNSNNSSGNTNNSDEKILNTIINGNSNNIVNRFQTLDSFEATINNVKVQEPIINERSMAADIVSSIKYMDVKGLEELTVKLNPRELGQVVINIIREGDAMKAQIKASSRETYQLLMKNSEDLKKYLGEQNLKVQDVEITFTNDTSYSKNDSFLGGYNKKKNNNESHKEGHNGNRSESYDSIEEDDDDLVSNINMLV